MNIGEAIHNITSNTNLDIKELRKEAKKQASIPEAQRNKERVSKYRKENYKRAYKFGKNLTFAERDQMIQNQLGLCIICSDQLKDPHVDHCHKTGKVRGILCPKCNFGLGNFNDDPSRIEAAAAYLRLYERFGSPELTL
jgi:catalase